MSTSKIELIENLMIFLDYSIETLIKDETFIITKIDEIFVLVSIITKISVITKTNGTFAIGIFDAVGNVEGSLGNPGHEKEFV